MKKSISILCLVTIISHGILAKHIRKAYKNRNEYSRAFSIGKENSSCTDSVVRNTSETKARKHTDYMAQHLKLSSEQKQQVYNLTLTKIKSMSALKTKYNSDIKAAQPEINTTSDKYDSALKSILTPEQLKKWQSIMEDHKIKSEEPAKINEYDPTILNSQW
jgi:hypothetical protein